MQNNCLYVLWIINWKITPLWSNFYPIHLVFLLYPTVKNLSMHIWNYIFICAWTSGLKVLWCIGLQWFNSRQSQDTFRRLVSQWHLLLAWFDLHGGQKYIQLETTGFTNHSPKTRPFTSRRSCTLTEHFIWSPSCIPEIRPFSLPCKVLKLE